MKIKNKIASLLSLLILAFATCFAQNAEETKSGYTGKFITGLETPKKAVNFLVVGDWGRNGQYHQQSVADQMGYAATTIGADFIISTGDNFYPKGVISTADPLWKTSFEDVYKAFSLMEDWNVVLGNHDYKGNTQAQIDYSKVSRRWQMPSNYFSKKIIIDGDSTQQILFVYTDTSPFVSKYYSEPDYKTNVAKQDTVAQIKWLNQVLADKDPNIKWKIVVGHHPLYCGGKRVKSKDTYDVRNIFEPIFKKHGVDAYLCGHEHDLQHIKPAGKTHYFVSGAGCEVRPTGITPDTKFAQAAFGFMAFTITNNNMLVQVIDDKGAIIYKTNVAK